MDFGCGCGRSTVSMAKGFPNATIIGYDMDQVSIDRANANKGTTKNVQFVCKDANDFDINSITNDQMFDMVAFLFCLHDFSQSFKLYFRKQ